MTGRIAEEKIREIRDRTDIVAFVSSYLPLRRAGGANHAGLCPFHAEKSPSFNVNAARQIFHCFGCGAGGDVLSFLMRMEGLSFPEAAKRLGERVGIEIEEEIVSPAEIKEREEKEQLARINEIACDFYHHLLLEDKSAAPARQYLKDRGYDGDTARRFRLGYAPDRWQMLAEHLTAKGFDLRWPRELGLIRPGKDGRDFDLFRNRLLFPILDLSGKVVAFGGRALDDALPKYLNSPESRLYHKGRLLFGLYQAREAMRQTGEGIIVEGYFDQMALHRAGFSHAVAACGTALTPEQARLLKRYAPRVTLLFDQDSAGQKATFRAMDVLLEEGIATSVVALDAGEDPDSFLRRHGADEFRRRLLATRPVLEAFIDKVLLEQGESIEGRARAVEEVLPRLRRLPGDIERELYLKLLANRIGVEETLLRSKLQQKGVQGNSAATALSPQRNVPVAAAKPQAKPAIQAREDAGAKAQQWLLHLLLFDGQMRQRVAGEGVKQLFFSPDYQMLAERVLQLEDKAPPEMLFSGELTEAQKQILSGILIKDEKIFADDPEQVFLGCRQAVKRECLKNRVAEIDVLVRQAEAAGDPARRTNLETEQYQIKRQLKNRQMLP